MLTRRYIAFTIQSLAVRFGGHKRNDSLAIYNLIQDNIMEIGKNIIDLLGGFIAIKMVLI
jgi:hypothetical protein